MLAPWANVSFTTFLYVSPVQTIPSCDQTGTPAIAFDGFLHFRSSIISGIGLQDQRPHAGQGLLAPIPQVAAPWLEVRERLHGRFLGLHTVFRPVRHLTAYGSTNRYRPVNRSNASGSSGE